MNNRNELKMRKFNYEITFVSNLIKKGILESIDKERATEVLKCKADVKLIKIDGEETFRSNLAKHQK